MSLRALKVDLKPSALHVNASGRPSMSVASAPGDHASTASHLLLRVKINTPKPIFRQ